MDEYSHEIRINGNPPSGFDAPSGDGWQYWVGTITDVGLAKGTNTIRVVRDNEGNDAFAVGTATIHREGPVEE